MDEVENIFKPLLMPILMIFIYVNTNKLSSLFSKLIFLALLFSMFGDVFLMPYFDNFILGLASFLIAHIFYIIAFLKNNKFVEGIKKAKSIALIVIVAYVGLIFLLVSSMLKTNTEIVLISAVVIYASVITVMVLSSISLFNNKNTPKVKLMMIGAILFMLSDSIIAINKFVVDVYLSGLWIMITYTLAQWLITVGAIKSDGVK
jgi:uncharacterized membrane protein YhhN